MKIFQTKERNIVRKRTFSRRDEEYNFTDHQKRFPTCRAKIAVDMATRWGMVAGKPDGEDTRGRAKLDLLSPKEVVDRAVKTADLLVSELEERGWFDMMPDLAELYAKEAEDDESI